MAIQPNQIRLPIKPNNMTPNQFNAAAIPLLRCSTVPAPNATKGSNKGRALISLAGAPMPKKNILHVKKTIIS